MSFDADDEILQDFLVEAGEILEQLGEQLVVLEQSPSDKDLLNAVFRGFHTIKGGASFLNLTSLVEVCHVAEDVFNLLRQGERDVDANLMDVILRVLDTLNDMFGYIRNGEEPPAAEATLMAQLNGLKNGEPAAAPAEQAPAAEMVAEVPSEPAAAPADAEASAPPPEEGEGDDISDEEFEKLLDALQDGSAQAAPAAAPAATAETGGDDITDDEFEALLDELHGKGKHGGAPQDGESGDAPAAETAVAASEDDITEEEFEALLDQLHGNGAPAGLPKMQTAPPQAAEPPAPAAEPAAAQMPPEPAAPPKPAAREVKAPDDAKQAKEPAGAQAETTVRVDTKRLDDIMNMVGELVLVRNRLVTLESALGNEQVAHAIGNLDLVTADLQAAVMKTRMQPIKKVFGRFPRVVRDLARSLKKEVSLEMQGEDTDLDKNLVEALADPLVHLVRNAVDHGVEMPDEREKAGKPRTGTVVLAAEQEGDHILLTISDDGKGMDAEVLRRKAVEKGIMDAETAARLDAKDCYNLIFAPGFSTKTEISDISGRGVGMDVVKTRIVQLNGSIEIDSQPGKGSRFLIKVPLTLAIMPTLMVMLGTQIFALPLVSVSEIFNLDLTHTNVVDGQLVIMVRDRPLPLYFLKQWLVHGGAGERPSTGHVVVVNVGSQRVGFVVEHLIGQEEVVIKPLGTLLHGIRGLAGATITGDGRIALILDVPGLMKAYARRF